MDDNLTPDEAYAKAIEEDPSLAYKTDEEIQAEALANADKPEEVVEEDEKEETEDKPDEAVEVTFKSTSDIPDDLLAQDPRVAQLIEHMREVSRPVQEQAPAVDPYRASLEAIADEVDPLKQEEMRLDLAVRKINDQQAKQEEQRIQREAPNVLSAMIKDLSGGDDEIATDLKGRLKAYNPRQIMAIANDPAQKAWLEDRAELLKLRKSAAQASTEKRTKAPQGGTSTNTSKAPQGMSSADRDAVSGLMQNYGMSEAEALKLTKGAKN